MPLQIQTEVVVTLCISIVVTAPCDASPVVTAAPIPYVCAGVPQTYCPGAIDPDGDSLYYSLVNPLGANAVPITHPAPYTPQAPLQNLVFDPTYNR